MELAVPREYAGGDERMDAAIKPRGAPFKVDAELDFEPQFISHDMV